MMQNNNNKRWPLLNNPFGFKMREKKPYIHPKINSFDEFNDKQKDILLKIKDVIFSKIGECKISVFGSQVNGNWDETSDYDIRVHKNVTPEVYQYLRNYDYGVRVDMAFSSEVWNNPNVVYIN